MYNRTIRGQIVIEYLEKWGNLPSNQLARMIYNSDKNNLIFKDKESVRTMVRYYRGQRGVYHRNKIATKKYFTYGNKNT